jgi:hypothetical protein
MGGGCYGAVGGGVRWRAGFYGGVLRLLALEVLRLLNWGGGFLPTVSGKGFVAPFPELGPQGPWLQLKREAGSRFYGCSGFTVHSRINGTLKEGVSFTTRPPSM